MKNGQKVSLSFGQKVKIGGSVAEKVFIDVYDVENNSISNFYFSKDKFFSYGENDKTFEEFPVNYEKNFLPAKTMGKKSHITTVYCSPKVEKYFKDHFQTFLIQIGKRGERCARDMKERVPIFGKHYTKSQLNLFCTFWECRRYYQNEESNLNKKIFNVTFTR